MGRRGLAGLIGYSPLNIPEIAATEVNESLWGLG